MKKLSDKKIQTRHFFAGMDRQPSLKKYGADCSGDYPVSDWLGDNGLYLPSTSNLSDDKIKYISDTIRLIHEQSR
jgi:perosamine synthetase